MAEDEVVRLVDKIKTSIETMTVMLKELGMTEKAIEKFFNGEEVIICHYCVTPNMFEVHYNKDNERSTYECLSCLKTHMKDWKKD